MNIILNTFKTNCENKKFVTQTSVPSSTISILYVLNRSENKINKHLKIFKFNNIKEIKEDLYFEEVPKKMYTNYQQFQNGENFVLYNNTYIKKVTCALTKSQESLNILNDSVSMIKDFQFTHFIVKKHYQLVILQIDWWKPIRVTSFSLNINSISSMLLNVE